MTLTYCSLNKNQKTDIEGLLVIMIQFLHMHRHLYGFQVLVFCSALYVLEFYVYNCCNMSCWSFQSVQWCYFKLSTDDTEYSYDFSWTLG